MIIYRPFNIFLNAVLKGTRSAINFIAGTNIALTVADNESQDRVDVTIAATGGGGSGSGDMTKAVYDTDDDGRVDKAESVDDGINVSSAADVKDAVTKKHTRQHAIDSAADHTGYGNSVTKNVGTGAEDVAAGNRGVTNGDSHTHANGDGGQINHTTLSNIGTNSHTQIDTFIASKAAANGLASLNANSLVVQNPANATATPTANKIPIADGNGRLTSWMGTFPKFFVHRNGVNQSIATNTNVKIQFTTETFDTNDNFDNTTNYRFTPTVAGYYSLHLTARLTALNDGNSIYIFIGKNGSAIASVRHMCSSSDVPVAASVSVIAYANGTTDYFEGYVWHNYGSAVDLAGGSHLTNFSGSALL